MTGPARGLRRAATVVVVLATLGAAASGCDDHRRIATPKEPKGTAQVYVALGGDDVEGGRRGLVTGWPQVLFRTAFPVTTEFVNLAGEREGIAEVRDHQVEDALALHPDVVTITVVDDAERGSDPVDVAADLGAVVTRLRTGTSTKVLVGTIPPDVAAPDVVDGLDAAVTAAAEGAGARVVDLGAVRAVDPVVRGRQIAAAFARSLDGSR